MHFEGVYYVTRFSTKVVHKYLNCFVFEGRSTQSPCAQCQSVRSQANTAPEMFPEVGCSVEVALE